MQVLTHSLSHIQLKFTTAGPPQKYLPKTGTLNEKDVFNAISLHFLRQKDSNNTFFSFSRIGLSFSNILHVIFMY